MSTMTLADCPNNCGYSSEGTDRQNAARIAVHKPACDRRIAEAEAEAARCKHPREARRGNPNPGHAGVWCGNCGDDLIEDGITGHGGQVVTNLARTRIGITTDDRAVRTDTIAVIWVGRRYAVREQLVDLAPAEIQVKP